MLVGVNPDSKTFNSNVLLSASAKNLFLMNFWVKTKKYRLGELNAQWIEPDVRDNIVEFTKMITYSA